MFHLGDDDLTDRNETPPHFWRRHRAVLILAALSFIVVGGTALLAWQAETRLNATEQKLYVFDKKPPALAAAAQLEESLGYEGFLGTLASFHAQPSLQTLQRLRNELDRADQALLTLAASAPLRADIRIQSLQGAVQFYKQALTYAEQVLAGNATANPSATQPLDDVYGNILVATARLERQYQSQNLALLRQQSESQGHLVWLSLFLSLGLVVGTWLVARGNYVRPLNKLLTSLQHKSAMDKNVPLWGINRSDTVGDIARTLEVLRQKLLNAPDIIVMRGEDAQPIRFGGAGGAVFQALVDELTSTVANFRAAEMPNTLRTIDELTKAMAASTGAVYEDLRTSADSIRTVSAELAISEDKTGRAADQLAERAQMMGEIAQLVGTQAQTSLRDLVGASGQIKNTAAAGDAVIRGFATKASDLSERLIAATNLMRAGGKVLQDTMESLRGRVLEAAAALTQNDARLSTWLAQSENRLAGLAARAEEAFEHGRAGHEAIAELAASSERIAGTVDRLQSSESQLTRAVTAMLSQSEQFAPLSLQLKDLHDQLTTHMTRQVATSEDVMTRLGVQTERLAQLNEELANGPLATAQQRLGKLAELSDSLAGIIEQVHGLPAKLAPLQQLQEHTIVALGTALDKNTAATEMNAIRMDANLRLIGDQLTELLQKLTTEQSGLLNQLNQLRDAIGDAPVAAITPQHFEDVQRALTSRIENQYQSFTAQLADLLQKFESAIAQPVVEQTAGAIEMSPVAQAVLSKLRREAPEDSALLDPGADLDVATAISRLNQIKKLTGALTRQTRVLGVPVEGDNISSDPNVLAAQARELITAVMEAITELTQLASDISDVSQKSL
jgi:hypothetical protein